MTIGIDARAAAEVPAGRGRYVRELLGAWPAGDALAFGRSATADGTQPWELIGAPDPLWHLRAAREASRSCAAFLSTNSYLTAWFTTVPTAVVVHDLIPFVVPELAQARAARIERATLGPAARRAKRFLCVSDATRRDLVARYPATEPRAVTVPLAASAVFSSGVAPADLGRPYVLVAGTLEPRKNLLAMLEAWAALPEDLRASHLLALVGPEGWDHARILDAARARPDDVRLLGHVDDAELAALYAGCAAFCFPSRFEGFGLPPLEAMAAGAPVVCSGVSSLPEVVGDAALLVDPLDPRSIRDGLEAVLRDPARAAALRAAGRERAAEFSWARTAAATHAVMRELAQASES